MERLSQELSQTLVQEQIRSRVVELLNEDPNINVEDVLTRLTSEPEPLENLDALLEEKVPELEAERDERLANYQMVIPLTEIQSVSFFDEDVHEDYKRTFASTPP